MKTQKTLFFAACGIIIALSVTSCKKNIEKKDCRISVFAGTGANDTVLYNNEGKISSIVNGLSRINYSYADNKVTGTAFDATGAFSYKTMATLNSAGLITNLRTEYNASGTQWGNIVYEYNGEELSQSTNTSSTGGTPSITTYRWLNHNIVSETTGANTTPWTFYTDKPRKDGDYLWLLKINYGGDILRTANLLKSFGTTNFSYEFDSDGKISSMGVSDGGSSQTITYEYTCN
jgi:hypothetical protein